MKYPISFVVALGLAITAWLLFQPGNFSFDSFVLYSQAMSGRFSDFHPAVLELGIFSLVKLGGKIGGLTLAFSISGMLGLRALTLRVIEMSATSKSVVDVSAAITILLLSSPLTPLLVFFTTLWVDTLLAIVLLWLLAAFAELWTKRSFDVTDQIVMIVLLSFTLLIRSNSIILYAVFAPMFYVSLKHLGAGTRVLMSCLFVPLLAYLGFMYFQYQVLRVQKSHVAYMLAGFDLASVMSYDPSICYEMPLKSCGLLSSLPQGFTPGQGAINKGINEGFDLFDRGFYSFIQNDSMLNDYVAVVRNYPSQYAWVKLLNFRDYLGGHDQYLYPTEIPPNDFGIAYGALFASERADWFAWLAAVSKRSALKYVSFVHAVWFVINLLVLLACMVLRPRWPASKRLLCLLCVPLVYDLSIFLGVHASEFRFMYPSMLIVQVIVCSTAFALGSRWGLLAICHRWRA